MTPAARVQAAIELLDAIIAAAREGGPPADRIIADDLRRRRYAGAHDRRAIRELVYGAIRACGPVPASGRAAMLRLARCDPAIAPLFDGSPHGPAPMAAGERPAQGGIAPAWLVREMAGSGIGEAEAAALLERAPLDVRVNTLRAGREALVLPESGERLPVPNGLRFPHGTPVEQWDAWRDGLIEVQDCGSQIVCLAARARPGETVIDLCAGAGGKTLALAAAMDNRGVLIAADTSRERLARLAPRARRAGALIARAILLDPGRETEALQEHAGTADCVLVDAPCSGTGTWRRNPEARWRIAPRRLAGYAAAQARLLDVAAGLVRPGGRIVYAVCSLLDAEGRDPIARFLSARPGWRADVPDVPLGRRHGEGIRLTSCHDGTDGFFIAGLARPC